ncbi:MAG: DUF2934 domain-containing protein [Hyalangium sp.]|uniref:DUF2934 domain-containing protein n=1 Tax=Hyalangium sp. TaxID=2028555 RepID=UPI003899FD5D
MARNNAKTTTPAETETAKAPSAPTQNQAQSQNTARTGPTHEQIARRAYEIFLARGGQPGNPEQDWHQAERELRLGRQ